MKNDPFSNYGNIGHMRHRTTTNNAKTTTQYRKLKRWEVTLADFGYNILPLLDVMLPDA
jgi:hypothetical protein